MYNENIIRGITSQWNEVIGISKHFHPLRWHCESNTKGDSATWQAASYRFDALKKGI